MRKLDYSKEDQDFNKGVFRGIFEQGNKKPLTTVSIPIAVIKMVKSLIPKKAKEELQKEGIDIKEIIKLSESPDFTGTVLEVDNHEKNEKVIISLEK